MKLIFIRNCPCIVEKTRRHFIVGQIAEVNEKDAFWMINCGYAIKQLSINPESKKIIENSDTKAIDPVTENKSIAEQHKKKKGRPKKQYFDG